MSEFLLNHQPNTQRTALAGVRRAAADGRMPPKDRKVQGSTRREEMPRWVTAPVPGGRCSAESMAG
jgi:hypothetical protein